AQQLAFGGFEILAQLEEAEGEAAGTLTQAVDLGPDPLRVLPALVLGLEGGRHAHELAPVEGRELAADAQGVASLMPGHSELHASGQGPDEGCVAPQAGAEPEPVGRVG